MNPLQPLHIDCHRETERITAYLCDAVARDLHRRGAVVALSGGVDSALCTALCARALGPDKVLALLLPERESSPSSLELGRLCAERFHVPYLIQDITAALDGLGCYARRDEAIRELFPDYTPRWKNKIVIGGALQGRFTFFRMVVKDPAGQIFEKRLPHRQYLQVLGAQNYKQRMRKAVEYHHADRLHYAVVGTPNRLEYEQAFFVKNGDGAADIKPIAHLYKTQVIALARHLGVPEEVCAARPTTDTYSLEQGQDEFFFALPYEQMDLALWAHDHGQPAARLASLIGVDERQAVYIYRDIEAKKRQAVTYQGRAPLLVEDVQVRGPG